MNNIYLEIELCGSVIEIFWSQYIPRIGETIGIRKGGLYKVVNVITHLCETDDDGNKVYNTKLIVERL